MPQPSVCAVVGGDDRAATLEAVGRQTREPDEVLTRAGSLPEVDWVWLLDGAAVPQPRALEALLEASDSLGSPILLASKILNASGSLDPGSLPVPDVADRDLAAAAANLGLVTIRVARSGSLLVRRSVLGAEGPPWSRLGGDLRWTARILKDGLGLLVPASVVVRQRPAPRLEVAGRLALLASGALAAREKPWFAFRLAEDVLTARRT